MLGIVYLMYKLLNDLNSLLSLINCSICLGHKVRSVLNDHEVLHTLQLGKRADDRHGLQATNNRASEPVQGGDKAQGFDNRRKAN